MQSVLLTIMEHLKVLFASEKLYFFNLGDVVPGLPPFQLPWQSRDHPHMTSSNGTILEATPHTPTTYDPFEILQDLGMGLVLLPLVSVLPQAATAQYYAGLINKNLSLLALVW